MRTKILLFSCVMALLAVACGTTTGKNGDEVGSTVPDSLRRTLQFITDLGINPDTLMMPECINYPVFADTVSHSHWLTADEAVTLGMQVLCGVDADGTPAQLMGIHPVSQEVTLLMFQVYYGDHSPVVLATYDKDGVIVDLMNAGMWAEVNTRYDGLRMSGGVDSTVMKLGSGGKFVLDRTLTQVDHFFDGAEIFGTHHATYDYQINPVTGIITLLKRTIDKADVAPEFAQQRQLEEITWSPMQDEEVMARFEALAQTNAIPNNYLDIELLLRLDFTPWSVLRWLYEHPSSRVKQLLMDAVKENQVDADRLKHAISTVDDPKVKQYWKDQFNLK